jgi:hypothetical protein
VLSPKKSPLGQALSQYVLVRIVRLDGVDLNLFDYDRHNTLYFFILNADEQIYMRYGGRDATSPDAYLNLASIEIAARKGLELHKLHQAGKLASAPKAKPVFAKDFPLLAERTIAQNRCVECHLVGDFQNQHRELDGTLDKLQHVYRSPDIKTIGIHLDVPKGLVVKEAKGAAAAAGMRAGDAIASVDGTAVYTFGDLQHHYDKLNRRASKLKLGVERDGRSVELEIDLPRQWWLTDIRYRQLTVDPRTYFESRRLSEAEKEKLGLKAGGFASEVRHVDMFAEITKSHELKAGDIVFSVDGAETDDVADTAELYIKLRKKAGDAVRLGVIRGGKRIEMKLTTFRMAFRK